MVVGGDIGHSMRGVAKTAVAAAIALLVSVVLLAGRAGAQSPATSTPSTAPGMRTIVTISLATSSYSVDAKVTGDRDDERLAGFVTGRQSLSEFLADATDGMVVADYIVPLQLGEEAPTITVDASTVTVDVRHQYGYSLVPPTVDTIAVGLDRPQPAGLTVVLHLTDFTVRSFSPAPSSADSSGTATWQGGRLANGIAVRVSYDLLPHLRDLRPSALLPQSWGYLVDQAGLAVLLAIPLVWALMLIGHPWLVRHPDDARVRRLLLGLLMLTIAALVLDAGDYVSVLCGRACQGGGNQSIARASALGELIVAGIVAAAGLLLMIAALPARPARILIGHRNLGGALFGGALVSAVPSLVILWAGARLDRLDYHLLAALLALPLALPLVVLGGRLARFGSWARETAWGFAALALGLAVSVPFRPFLATTVGDLPNSDQAFFAVRGWSVVVAFTLVATLAAVAMATWLFRSNESSDRTLSLGAILFAGYLAGSTDNWFLVPVSFVLALVVYGRWLIRPEDQRKMLDLAAPDVVARRAELIRYALSKEAATRMAVDVASMDKRVSSGEMTVAAVLAQQQAVDDYIADLTRREPMVQPNTSEADLVLAVGEDPSPRVNAVRAIRVLLAPALVLTGVAVFGALADETFHAQPFPQVEIASRGLATLGGWLIGAFFFGYFFLYLRGDSGLSKGLRVGAVLVAASLPLSVLRLHSGVDVGSLALSTSETILFYALAGIAFDYLAVRKAQRRQFRWSQFARLGDMRLVSTAATVIVATVGVALTSALAGQLATILGSLLQGALSGAPRPPSGK